ncbi:hypothetical protein J3R83DRAFT_7780 [Lanmaoa asiatica]|nr:hypothetical protein J3R83DRAFT_7780 [Lanmaoa asiatica]
MVLVALLLHTTPLTSIYDQAIDVQPSIVAFMAKSIAYVGNEEKDKGYHTCDIVFEHLHSSHFTFLLFIKAIIVFTTGDHIDVISRLDDLIATVQARACRAAMRLIWPLTHPLGIHVSSAWRLTDGVQ